MCGVCIGDWGGCVKCVWEVHGGDVWWCVLSVCMELMGVLDSRMAPASLASRCSSLSAGARKLPTKASPTSQAIPQ